MRATRERYEKDPDCDLNNRKYFKELVVIDQVTTWRSFQKWVDELQDSWVFRGQAKAAWDLETRLDRHTSWEQKSKTSYLYERRAAFYERPLLRDFQRNAHQYFNHLPADNEIIDWLALMQHNGAPTRLLDWTRSPYVGPYFAVEKEIPGKNSAAVWAIDHEWVLKELAMKFDTHLSDADSSARVSSYSNGILNKQLAGEEGSDDPKKVIVAPAIPKRVNERMAAQQGLFLCNLNVRYQFDIALMGMILRDEKPDKPPVRKLIVRPKEPILFLKELRRMNITAASLFPDVGGFTRSLVEGLEIQMFLDGLKIKERESHDLQLLSTHLQNRGQEQDP